MAVINTNVPALIGQNAIEKNQRVLKTTMESLATGSRINSASDDAASQRAGSTFTRRDAHSGCLSRTL